MKQPSNFVIIGAGPKALAVTAKAYTLKKLFSLPMPNFHIVEKNEIGGNWTGRNGFTNGYLKLGTSPQKDVGFPYDSKIFGNKNDSLINSEMRKFSWDMYLIHQGKYAEWIDRGRPAPTHFEWSQYLKHGLSLLKDFVHIHQSELVEIRYKKDKFGLCLREENKMKNLDAQYLMITGPGESNLKRPIESERIFDINSYWKVNPDFNQNENILIIGGGENSATIALDIHYRLRHKNININIITPSGILTTRGESYFENRIYTDPSHAHWKKLSIKEKTSFIRRTDLGVYSVEAMNELGKSAHLNIIKGIVQGCSEFNKKIVVSLTEGFNKCLTYDYVIWANGFQKTGLLRSKINKKDKENIERLIGKISDKNLESRIGHDLSLIGIEAKIFLPMISGLSQGPGFSNLSSLGTLSDRILHGFTSVQCKELHNVSY